MPPDRRGRGGGWGRAGSPRRRPRAAAPGRTASAPAPSRGGGSPPRPPRRWRRGAAGGWPRGFAVVGWGMRGVGEVCALRLVALDGLEQRLEVALAEAAGATALDDLVEEGGAVTDRTGEDLQEVSVLLEVDEDAEPAQV